MKTGCRVPSKNCVARLLAAAVLLPIAIVVPAAFGQLLRALGDAAGAAVLMRFVLGVGILWVLALIGLLLAVAVKQVGDGCTIARDDEIERE
jgi:uncharacterized membrane protein